MNTIYRVLRKLKDSRAEENDFIIESYGKKPEDYTMPWEKYLAKDIADVTNRHNA